MKKSTPLQQAIAEIEKELENDFFSTAEKSGMITALDIVKKYLPLERENIEISFYCGRNSKFLTRTSAKIFFDSTF